MWFLLNESFISLKTDFNPELEHSRDELLYEQHKLEHHSQADILLLQRYFNEVNVVSDETFKVVSAVVNDALVQAKERPELLVAALRLVEREQVVDAEVERKKTYSGQGSAK